MDKSKRYDDLINLLIKVIPNAGKSKSHRIKQLITCCIKTGEGKTAIKYLQKYKNGIDELSYNNLYISALEITGDFSQTEIFLNNLISSTYRIEYKLNYMNKLAMLYQKNEFPDKAVSAYEQWKKFYASNRSGITMGTAVAAISKLEVTVDRNLCVLYYISGKREDAKVLARKLLIKNSEDSIAQHILDDSYVSPANKAESLSDYNDEYAYFEASDDSVPKLVEWMLNNVDYERQFFNQSILKNVKENRQYIGDENQAKTDINHILDASSDRSFAERSAILMALAKIIRQFVEIGATDDYFTQKKLNLFLGRSLLFKADADIERSYQNRDCLRYYYFLSLRYLSRSGDNSNLFHAINMLYISFFLSDNELDKASKKNGFDKHLRVTPPEYKDSVIFVKELMTCTFDLDINYRHSKLSDMKIVRKIIDAIFENDRLRKEFEKEMLSLLQDSFMESNNTDEFFGVWKKAREIYNKIQNDLNKYINDAANRIDEPEKLKNCLNKIDSLKPVRILSKTDLGYLESIIDILDKFNKVNELIIIDDRVDTLDKVIDCCETLEKSIRETPTNFSYEKMLDYVTMLKGKALKLKNNLYGESKPNLNVYRDDTSF